MHGLLSGCVALAFVWTFLGGSSSGGSSGGGGAGSDTNAGPSRAGSPPAPGAAPPLAPDVEAALRAALADAKPRFLDPEVHAALEEMRADPAAGVAKHRNNAAVMGALAKLLEIEGILERL